MPDTVLMKIKRKICCVYSITSKVNGNIYIGGTTDFKTREANHIDSLKRNHHFSNKLQKHFNKYSLDIFEFKIIEICSKEDLKEKEKSYIWKINPKFNVWKKGYHLSKQQKQQISELHKGRINSEDIKKKMREGQTSPKCRGYKLSEETKKRMSIARSGRKNHFYGKTHSEASKLKISISKKGVKHKIKYNEL